MMQVCNLTFYLAKILYVNKNKSLARGPISHLSMLGCSLYNRVIKGS
jgi:hypothetical protein